MTIKEVSQMQLKTLRKRAGVSQVLLAEQVGVAQPTISDWETGRYEPTLTHIKRLMEVLNCTSDELLGFKQSIA